MQYAESNNIKKEKKIMMKRMMSLAMAGLVTVSMMAGCGQVQTDSQKNATTSTEGATTTAATGKDAYSEDIKIAFCQMLSVIPAQQRGQME